MNVLTVGGSRNIGYFASVRLLKAGATVTFLLRHPGAFEQDETIQEHVKSGKARLVQGDALVREDCEKAWKTAQGEGDEARPVDLLLFTVGAVSGKFSLRKGFLISPPDLTTRCFLNLARTLPRASPTKIVLISSTGISKASHAALPLPLRPLYGWLLGQPHLDKLGLERVAAHCAGWTWDARDAVSDGVLGAGWATAEGMPAEGAFKGRVVVVRPALLTDGECVADKPKRRANAGVGYRVAQGDLPGAWTVSRKDVAHFIAEGILNKWDEYKDKYLSIAY